VLFPFVTRPPLTALITSLRHLTILGALEVDNRGDMDRILDLSITNDPTKLTDLGSLLAKLPLSPKFAKMLVVAIK
jgi:HrpA-like RNA helicase